MKIAAIICEYNPLHKGHLHQIVETKRLTGCDAVMCIMSGNFSQRAECTIMDKFERAKVAVLNGTDIVINIPIPYSANNAEVFSLAAVKIANSFKNVKWLSFGMEQPKLEVLEETADFLLNETPEYKTILKENLGLGISFNESRINTVKKLIEEGKLKLKHRRDVLKLLTMPNNILAVEYVKALKQLNSHIEPVLIKRVGSNYNDKKLKGTFSSATSIRTKIYATRKVRKVKKALPESSYLVLESYINTNGLINKNKLTELAKYKFITSSHKDLKKLYNVSEGLENRIKTVAERTITAEDFKTGLQTKRYKTSRLNSIMLNAVLDINATTVKHIYEIEKLPYLKVLAINADKMDLLKHLKCKSKLILRKKDTDGLRKTKFVKELIDLEKKSNLVYNMLLGKNVLKPNDLYTVVLKVKQKSE
jgi:predicted nucleotidyltransferase